MNEEASSIRFNQDFNPEILLISIFGLFGVNIKTGQVEPRAERCLVCEKHISEGYQVIIDNGIDDKMEIGCACKTHQPDDIANHAISKLSEILQTRVDQISHLEPGSLVVKTH